MNEKLKKVKTIIWSTEKVQLAVNHFTPSTWYGRSEPPVKKYGLSIVWLSASACELSSTGFPTSPFSVSWRIKLVIYKFHDRNVVLVKRLTSFTVEFELNQIWLTLISFVIVTSPSDFVPVSLDFSSDFASISDFVTFSSDFTSESNFCFLVWDSWNIQTLTMSIHTKLKKNFLALLIVIKLFCTDTSLLIVSTLQIVGYNWTVTCSFSGWNLLAY